MCTAVGEHSACRFVLTLNYRIMKIAQKITPFLWSDDNAEEAINFYISVFENGACREGAESLSDKQAVGLLPTYCIPLVFLAESVENSLEIP